MKRRSFSPAAPGSCASAASVLGVVVVCQRDACLLFARAGGQWVPCRNPPRQEVPAVPHRQLRQARLLLQPKEPRVN